MDAVLHWVSAYGYAAIFSLLVLGIVGLPVPDEWLLVFSGYLVYSGHLTAPATFAAALSGSICGITCSYLVGRRVGLPLLHSRLGRRLHISDALIERVHDWFHRIGHWTLVIGYYIPGVRHFTAVIAGTSALEFRDFALFAYSGALVWVSTFLFIGYHFGEHWRTVLEAVEHHLKTASWVALAILCIYFGVRYLRMRFLLVFCLLIACVGLFGFQGQSDWDRPFPPHKIAENLYYVGTKGLSSYLITTPEGHILINSSFDRSVPLIRASVEKLGFKFTDIKILLGSHAHSDHMAGNFLVKDLTGAKVFVMQGDAAVVESGGKGQYLYKELWKPCKVDRVLKDGDTVKLGGAVLTAHLTPGHTRGNTTWTMNAVDRGKTYLAVIVGSPNVNEGYKLKGNTDYPEIAADFTKTFQVLKSLRCGIFLGAHGNYYGMEEKYAKLGKGGANPFVDPEGYQMYIEEREKAFLSR